MTAFSRRKSHGHTDQKAALR